MSLYRLHLAAEQLRRGGVIAYPTEGVWGLGCDPNNPEAVRRLLSIKGRDFSKGLILLGGEYQQISPYLQALPPQKQEKINTSWPGFVTWVLPADKSVPQWLTGGRDTLAVRVTPHPLIQQLCLLFGGAIISTSANRSGRSSALCAEEVFRELGNALDYVLLGDTLGAKGPSEIRQLDGQILRKGC